MSKHGVDKSSGLYQAITLSWAAVLSIAIVTSWHSFRVSWHTSSLLGVLSCINLLFIAYFWLNGTKDVAYTLSYHFGKLKHGLHVPAVAKLARFPRVVMLYCTYNDFNADSLLASMPQDYPNFYVVILDDSTKEEYRQAVDEFAQGHGLRVVRRSERVHAKAGNLNHFLQSSNDWEHFVILDSDERVPANFISRALDYMTARPDTGIVQGNHRATRNRNAFMQRFAIGVDSHWMAYQTVKNRYGFMSLLGHGAMVSRACYEAAGGFPNVVAEDICLSIAARKSGYKTVFARDIMCEEEFPVDYLAFKRRHDKWTQGNMEFIRRFTRQIFGGGLTWFEKLDIVLFTYSLPLTAVFSIYVVINALLLPALHYNIQYPLWMLVPTVLFLMAPMLNDIMFYFGKMKTRTLVAYLFQSTILFGSMFYTSLVASAKSAFGKSVFLTTPKEDRTITFREALRSHRGALVCALILAVATIALSGGVFSVLLLILPLIGGLALIPAHMPNKQKVPTAD